MMLWRRNGGDQPDDEPPVDEPSWQELSALDSGLRDREQFLRRGKAWEKEWPTTELLETLRAKLRRVWHRRHP